MNKNMLKMSLIIGLVMLAVSPLLAADEQTFEQKEQQLLSAAEPEVQTEAKAETIEIPKEVGEEDGFWTKIKKAFATKEEKPDLDNKTEQEIQVLMFEGRTYYRKGEYQKALNTFAEVTKRDPYNPLARRYMSSCNEKLLRIEEDNVDLTALQRIQDVEKSMLIMTEKQKDRDEAVANAGISTVTDEKMNRVIKELNFVDEPMANVLESIREEANLNLVMQPAVANAIQNATLTLSLDYQFKTHTAVVIWAFPETCFVISAVDVPVGITAPPPFATFHIYKVVFDVLPTMKCLLQSIFISKILV